MFRGSNVTEIFKFPSLDDLDHLFRFVHANKRLEILESQRYSKKISPFIFD